MYWFQKSLLFAGCSVGLAFITGCSSTPSNTGNHGKVKMHDLTLRGSYTWKQGIDPELTRLTRSNRHIEELYFENKFIVYAQIVSVKKSGKSQRIQFMLSSKQDIHLIPDSLPGEPSDFRLTNEVIHLDDHYGNFPFKSGHVVELSFAAGDKLTSVYLSTYEVGPKILNGSTIEIPRFSYSPRKDNRKERFQRVHVSPLQAKLDHVNLSDPRYLGMNAIKIIQLELPEQLQLAREQLADARKEADPGEDLNEYERAVRLSEEGRIECDGLVYSFGKLSIITQEKGPGASNLRWVLKNKKP